MNLYRGCCHGCIYCDSRSDCYGIEDFDRVRAKQDALPILERELRSKRKKGVIGMGAMSDPYNPFEAELNLTRGALMLIEAFGFGVVINTKSDLITRDADVLARIAWRAPVLAGLTVTAASDSLSAKIEPRAPSSSRRLAAIRTLSEAGIFAGVLMMPILPFIEDTEENILGIATQAQQSQAAFIFPALGVTMRGGGGQAPAGIPQADYSGNSTQPPNGSGGGPAALPQAKYSGNSTQPPNGTGRADLPPVKNSGYPNQPPSGANNLSHHEATSVGTTATASSAQCQRHTWGVPSASQSQQCTFRLPIAAVYLPFANRSSAALGTSGILERQASWNVRQGMRHPAAQYEHLLRALDRLWPGMRRRYEQRFSGRYHCPARNAGHLYKILARMCREAGIPYEMDAIVHAFQDKYTPTQLTFF